MYHVTVNYGKKEWEEEGKNGRFKTQSELSKKTLPYTLTVSGLNKDSAAEVFLKWIDAAEKAGAEKMDESTYSATYYEFGQVFEVQIKYPRDFSYTVTQQRGAVRSIFRSAAREIIAS